VFFPRNDFALFTHTKAIEWIMILCVLRLNMPAAQCTKLIATAFLDHMIFFASITKCQWWIFEKRVGGEQ
jgi:hypothetical protein